jgi:hypothetical protein
MAIETQIGFLAARWISLVFVFVAIGWIFISLGYVFMKFPVRNAYYKAGITLAMLSNLIYQFTCLYERTSSKTVTIGFMQVIFGTMIFMFFGLIDFYVLEIYQILNPKISKLGLKWWKLAVVLAYLFIVFFHVIVYIIWPNGTFDGMPIVYNPFRIWMRVAFVFLVVSYDQVQNVYLTLLVLKSIKNQHAAHKDFIKMIRLNTFLVLLDLCGLAAFAGSETLAEENPWKHTGLNFANAILGFHTNLSIMLFWKLLQLKLAERRQVALKPAPQVKKNDINSIPATMPIYSGQESTINQ